MPGNNQRPEALDLFNSIFEDSSAPQEPAAEPVKAEEPVMEEKPEMSEPHEEVRKDPHPQKEEAERKDSGMPSLDIESMFEELVKTDTENPKAEEQQNSYTEKPRETTSPTPLNSYTENPAKERPQEYKNPVYEKRDPVKSRGGAKPVRKRVSSRAVEEIITNMIGTAERGHPHAVSAYLVSLSSGQALDIGSGVTIIGSSGSQANIVIEGNPTVSRRHAAIEYRDGRFLLRDMGSLNGTRLNGRALAPNHEKELRSGDKIMISNEPFEFRY